MTTDTTTTPAGAPDRSPPTTGAPARDASEAMPRARSTAHATSRSGSAASETSRAVGSAPIAAMSARFWAASFTPTSCALDQSSRQSRPHTIESVVATTLPITPQGFGTRDALAAMFFARFATGESEAERLGRLTATTTAWGVSITLAGILLGIVCARVVQKRLLALA